MTISGRCRSETSKRQQIFLVFFTFSYLLVSLRLDLSRKNIEICALFHSQHLFGANESLLRQMRFLRQSRSKIGWVLADYSKALSPVRCCPSISV